MSSCCHVHLQSIREIEIDLSDLQGKIEESTTYNRNGQDAAHRVIKSLKSSQGSSSYFFRGMHNIDYRLMPSIARNRRGNLTFNYNDEKIAFRIISSEGTMYAQRGNLDDLHLLALAQHFGAPTRLLDWTFNPYVALYFSIFANFRIDDKYDGIIYAYQTMPDEFERRELKLAPEYNEEPLIPLGCFSGAYCVKFIVPKFIDERIKNQKGLFSIQSNPVESFDENCSVKNLSFIRIPKEVKLHLAEYLFDVGMSHDFIMPGLSGFCETVGYRYRHNKSLRSRYF